MKELNSFYRFVNKNRIPFAGAINNLKRCYDDLSLLKEYANSMGPKAPRVSPYYSGWDTLQPALISFVSEMIDKGEEKRYFPELRDVFMQFAGLAGLMNGEYTPHCAFINKVILFSPLDMREKEHRAWLKVLSQVADRDDFRFNLTVAKRELKDEETVDVHNLEAGTVFWRFCSSPYFLYAQSFYSQVVFFTAIVESVFLEKGLDKDLFFYLKIWDVPIVKYLPCSIIAKARGWTEKYTYQLAKGYDFLSFYSRFGYHDVRWKISSDIPELDDFYYALTDGLVNEKYDEAFYDRNSASFYNRCQEEASKSNSESEHSIYFVKRSLSVLQNCRSQRVLELFDTEITRKFIATYLGILESVFLKAETPNCIRWVSEYKRFEFYFNSAEDSPSLEERELDLRLGERKEYYLDRACASCKNDTCKFRRSVSASVEEKPKTVALTDYRKREFIKKKCDQINRDPTSFYMKSKGDEIWEFYKDDGQNRYRYAYLGLMIKLALGLKDAPWTLMKKIVEINLNPRSLSTRATELTNKKVDLPSGIMAIKLAFQEDGVEEEMIFKVAKGKKGGKPPKKPAKTD